MISKVYDLTSNLFSIYDWKFRDMLEKENLCNGDGGKKKLGFILAD